MAVIAMTREMATLGKDVAQGLAERLKLDVIHHELVEHDISKRAGLSESEVHRFLEGEASLLERWRINRAKLSRYTELEILELASKGNVLIRGWGATYLLRSLPHVVCVRICAPMAHRERVLMQRIGIAQPAVARREIERNDSAHNGVMQRLFGIDWKDPTFYAATLNTARIPVADCVEHIAQLTASEAFQETPRAHTMLADLLLEARVRSAIDERFDGSIATFGLEAHAEHGKVTLSGAISDERLIADIVRHVHTVEGVKGVESQIHYLAFARNFA